MSTATLVAPVSGFVDKTRTSDETVGIGVKLRIESLVGTGILGCVTVLCNVVITKISTATTNNNDIPMSSINFLRTVFIDYLLRK
ncbi:hypothetical protein COU88_01755 [Candidatus Roizmanbacteria bacterium CG10_big_fil_rev_8_21_14_0_10_39_6]|uniref:Uncharacterized protein n=1 Tax=Candidatus Roizmanbacteria bacterium CG10_big_fil_rev_8_21_14_0_10_39_6 TaxID=1974853 RepID=A0A2M8KT25_9BACT|nr:MAG: hypothetical protein COU88_01755 [Candidatus Roizmanbacteria bacterium CG10_big_fil_rev_8_21_14_0_10_39_6]